MTYAWAVRATCAGSSRRWSRCRAAPAGRKPRPAAARTPCWDKAPRLSLFFLENKTNNVLIHYLTKLNIDKAKHSKVCLKLPPKLASDATPPGLSERRKSVLCRSSPKSNTRISCEMFISSSWLCASVSLWGNERFFLPHDSKESRPHSHTAWNVDNVKCRVICVI